MAGAWEVQDHMDRLADAADNPRGLERGLATMSAVAEQRTKLQVSHVAVDWSTAKSLPVVCLNQPLQITSQIYHGSLLVAPGIMSCAATCNAVYRIRMWREPPGSALSTCGMQIGAPLHGVLSVVQHMLIRA